jgi:hypothetical protein
MTYSCIVEHNPESNITLIEHKKVKHPNVPLTRNEKSSLYCLCFLTRQNISIEILAHQEFLSRVWLTDAKVGHPQLKKRIYHGLQSL